MELDLMSRRQKIELYGQAADLLTAALARFPQDLKIG